MYGSYDLIPDITKLLYLFVLESPHSDELAANLPCAGEAGKRMCQEIFGSSDFSLGEYLRENLTDSEKFGIMNSFAFPLGIPSLLTSKQREFCLLKDLVWLPGVSDRSSFYSEHLDLLGKIGGTEEVSQFKNRLTGYSNAPNLRLIIFCGYIAQAMFLHSYTDLIPPYNKLYKIACFDHKNISLLFVNHPSARNSEWNFNRKVLHQI